MKRETALDLTKELEQSPPAFVETAALSENPETVGTRLRRALDVGTEHIFGDAREHFSHWRSALEHAGVLVFQAEKIALEEMRGFSVTERPLPVAVVNIKDAVSARTFSLFHEAAHILLGRGGLCNFEEDERSSQRQRVEVFCNHVSGATLVPADILWVYQKHRNARFPTCRTMFRCTSRACSA